MGIVEAFVCVVGFLTPQFFPIPFAFPSHFCRICNFYHSSHSRSSEMDLSRHKSHPVFSSLLFVFRFYLFVYSRWTFYMRKKFTYGREEWISRIFCIKAWDRMGGILSKTLLALNRLQRCCIGGILLYFCVFIFSLLCYLGLRGTGDWNFASERRANIFSITGRVIGFVQT